MFELLITLIMAVVPACPTEDSTSCVWDGPTRGNGIGPSVLIDHRGDPALTW